MRFKQSDDVEHSCCWSIAFRATDPDEHGYHRIHAEMSEEFLDHYNQLHETIRVMRSALVQLAKHEGEFEYNGLGRCDSAGLEQARVAAKEAIESTGQPTEEVF